MCGVECSELRLELLVFDGAQRARCAVDGRLRLLPARLRLRLRLRLPICPRGGIHVGWQLLQRHPFFCQSEIVLTAC